MYFKLCFKSRQRCSCIVL